MKSNILKQLLAQQYGKIFFDTWNKCKKPVFKKTPFIAVNLDNVQDTDFKVLTPKEAYKIKDAVVKFWMKSNTCIDVTLSNSNFDSNLDVSIKTRKELICVTMDVNQVFHNEGKDAWLKQFDKCYILDLSKSYDVVTAAVVNSAFPEEIRLLKKECGKKARLDTVVPLLKARAKASGISTRIDDFLLDRIQYTGNESLKFCYPQPKEKEVVRELLAIAKTEDLKVVGKIYGGWDIYGRITPIVQIEPSDNEQWVIELMKDPETGKYGINIYHGDFNVDDYYEVSKLTGLGAAISTLKVTYTRYGEHYLGNNFDKKLKAWVKKNA